MANKKLQYQSLSNVILPLVAAAATPTALCFSSFSQPLVKTTFPASQQQSVLFEVGFLGPAQVPPWFVFSKFEPPKFSTAVPAHLQQTTFFVVPPAPAPTPTSLVFSQFIPQFNRGMPAALQPQPTFRVTATSAYDIGTPIFSTFVHVLRAKLPVCVDFANFAHLTAPDFPPIQEKHDGLYVKKKRKPTARELDPYAEEAEIKRLRRKAIEDAIYGPEVEYLPTPLAFPIDARMLPPDLGDLPQIVFAAQQKAIVEANLKKARDEEDDLEQILKGVL